jgi:hypothetical protein
MRERYVQHGAERGAVRRLAGLLRRHVREHDGVCDERSGLHDVRGWDVYECAKPKRVRAARLVRTRA